MSTSIGYRDIAKLLMNVLISQRFCYVWNECHDEEVWKHHQRRPTTKEQNKAKQKVTKMSKTGVIRVARDG